MITLKMRPAHIFFNVSHLAHYHFQNFLPTTSVLVLSLTKGRKPSFCSTSKQKMTDVLMASFKGFKGPDCNCLPFLMTVKTAPKYAAILNKRNIML